MVRITHLTVGSGEHLTSHQQRTLTNRPSREPKPRRWATMQTKKQRVANQRLRDETSA